MVGTHGESAEGRPHFAKVEGRVREPCVGKPGIFRSPGQAYQFSERLRRRQPNPNPHFGTDPIHSRTKESNWSWNVSPSRPPLDLWAVTQRAGHVRASSKGVMRAATSTANTRGLFPDLREDEYPCPPRSKATT
jgi:hypothetical protein